MPSFEGWQRRASAPKSSPCDGKGKTMGPRLINNSRRTKIGHVEAFPVLHMRWLRKSAMFNEGQRTEGHFLYSGVSNAITIIVDLRSEHDLKVLLEVGHTQSATNMQVIGLTHRPTGFHGRRWYFVSANGERAETLFLVGGFFRTRTEAGLTYRSQSQGELDRALDRRRKLQVQLEGTGARGPARGRRRKQAKEELAEIQRLLAAFESGLSTRDDYLDPFDYLRPEFDMVLNDITHPALYPVRATCAKDKCAR